MANAELTTTLTVNAAFFQEIKEVNQELWKLLDVARQMCLDRLELRVRFPRWTQLLSRLRDQLAMHFALEEAYGYFEDPVSVAPARSERAYQLRAEHPQLYQAICDLAERAEESRRHALTPGTVLALSRDFLRFDHDLKEHETLENELILEEYDGDIGVGD